MARRDGRPATNRDAKDTRCRKPNKQGCHRPERAFLLTAPPKADWRGRVFESLGVELGVELWEVSACSLAGLDPPHKQGSPPN
jgi:hypothetical protein